MKKPRQAEKKAPTVQKQSLKWWQKKYFFEALVFIFTFLLFANSIPNDYSMDDELVTINHRLTSKGISAIPEIFASPYYQDDSGYSYEYRPVVLTSFAIEHQFFGDNPHVSHFWNVILYAFFCMLLYRLLLLLFSSYSPLLSLAITLIFAAHPAHTEVVCSIKNRDEILGLGFSLLAFFYAVKSMQTRKLWTLLLVPLFFVLSLLSKLTFLSFAFIIPLAILLFEPFDLGRLLFIVVSLLTSVVAISNIGNNLLAKSLVVSAGALPILVIYCYRNFAQVKAGLFDFYKRFLAPDHYRFSGEQVAPSDRSTFIKDILAPFSALTFKNIGLFTLLSGVYIIAVIYNVYLIQLAVSCILGLLVFEKNENREWLAYLSICLIVAFRSFYLGIFHQDYFLDLFSLPIVFNLLLGKRLFFIPSVISLMSIVVLFALKGNFDMGYFMPLSIAANIFMQRFRFGWIFIVISFAVPFITGITEKPFILYDFSINVLYNSLAALLFASVYFKKPQWNIAKFLLVLTLAFALILNIQQQKDTQLLNKSVYAIKDVSAKAATDENRPIQYVENCIDFIKTPQTIKAGISFEILFNYLGKTIVPYPLSFYYGYSFIRPMKITDTIPMLSLILHLLLLIIAALCYRNHKLICFGILLYLLSIITFANYFQAVPGMMADRFLLVPSLGWSIVLAVIIQKLFKIALSAKERSLQSIPNSAKFTFLAILLFYSSLSFARNLKWKSYLTLFENDISYVDNSSQAHNLLALRLMKTSYDQGVPAADQLAYRKKAAIHFRRAVEIYPPFFNANYDLGRTYQILENPDSAIFFYNKALEINPDFATASLAVGELYMRENKPKEAIPYYQKVVKGFPKDYTGYDKLSYALFMDKDYSGSISVLKKANEEIPQNEQPLVNLYRVYRTINRDDSARYWLQKAIDLNPADQQAKTLLQNLK